SIVCMLPFFYLIKTHISHSRYGVGVHLIFVRSIGSDNQLFGKSIVSRIIVMFYILYGAIMINIVVEIGNAMLFNNKMYRKHRWPYLQSLYSSIKRFVLMGIR